MRQAWWLWCYGLRRGRGAGQLKLLGAASEALVDAGWGACARRGLRVVELLAERRARSLATMGVKKGCAKRVQPFPAMQLRVVLFYCRSTVLPTWITHRGEGLAVDVVSWGGAGGGPGKEVTS